MDGRRPIGVMYVNTTCKDPAKNTEYDVWYQTVHFPDVQEPGIFVNATMFHNVNSTPRQGEGTFLALYETYWPDPAAGYVEFSKTVSKLRAEGRIHPQTGPGFAGLYWQRAVEFASHHRRHSHALVAVRITLEDRVREREYKEWCIGTHLKEAIGTGLFHTASFNDHVEHPAYPPRASQARFLLLYETDLGDPAFSYQELVNRCSPLSTEELRRSSYVSLFSRAPRLASG